MDNNNQTLMIELQKDKPNNLIIWSKENETLKEKLIMHIKHNHNVEFFDNKLVSGQNKVSFKFKDKNVKNTQTKGLEIAKSILNVALHIEARKLKVLIKL